MFLFVAKWTLRLLLFITELDSCCESPRSNEAHLCRFAPRLARSRCVEGGFTPRLIEDSRGLLIEVGLGLRADGLCVEVVVGK